MFRRCGLSVAPRFLWQCLTNRRKLVSSPHHIARSVRMCSELEPVRISLKNLVALGYGISITRVEFSGLTLEGSLYDVAVVCARGDREEFWHGNLRV